MPHKSKPSHQEALKSFIALPDKSDGLGDDSRMGAFLPTTEVLDGLGPDFVHCLSDNFGIRRNIPVVRDCWRR
eukprot:CAMPEP_0115394566 /NCGR_PEP_ID=MMETSP0271-20121206/12333_1 /TAXON_ID=71861 /ORGANISM="Scrippsiella trochoidea, Strain CCMP3099" /LENGTH=72 /DNA_ID=CAMNT_0002818243 /DNA_START=114 /DNA_END=332 /DNA_ORIENTATION=-